MSHASGDREGMRSMHARSEILCAKLLGDAVSLNACLHIELARRTLKVPSE